MRQIEVALGAQSYDVIVGSGVLFELPRILAGRRAVLISDQKPFSLHRSMWDHKDLATLFAHRHFMDFSEDRKTLKTVEEVFQILLPLHIDRSTVLVASGGGVAGDLLGFVAATILRGISWIQVPTTLLAQVDASVGGKVGINMARTKNMIGAFHQPEAVLADTTFLDSLPAREIRSGLAEIVKACAIAKTEMLPQLEALAGDQWNVSPGKLEALIGDAIEMKAEVVSADERESGLRANLNFGHTLGHAVETLAKGLFTHGEAVIVGMRFALDLSERLGVADKQSSSRLRNLLQSFPLPDFDLKGLEWREIWETMQRDKKRSSKAVRFVLWRTFGDVRLTEVTEEQIRNTYLTGSWGERLL